MTAPKGSAQYIAHHPGATAVATVKSAPPLPANCCVPGVPDRNMLMKYAVNRPGWEAVRWSLFDSAAYAAAGVTTLAFFSLPVGQGTGFGGGTKTYSDTNMTNAGMLPAAQEFLIKNIDVSFYPTTPTVAAQMPAAFGAQAIAQIVNDAYIFGRSGNLALQIGSKNYAADGPLMKFPPRTHFHLDAALSDVSSTAASLQSRIAFGHAAGSHYAINPNIYLISNQNFGVTLAWPEGVQAITNPARVFVTMDGLLYRQSQ